MNVLTGRPERRSGATFCVLLEDGHYCAAPSASNAFGTRLAAASSLYT
jgi:hypothetical protein